MLEGLQKVVNRENLIQPRGMQLLFRDNNTFIFRTLPIEHTVLIEKSGEKPKRVWKHYYKTQYPFNGYKNVPSGMVTLSFERDIIFDPHGILKASEKIAENKPGEQPDLKRLMDIANSRSKQLRAERGSNYYWDKLTMFLGIVLVCEAIAIIIKAFL